MKKLILKLLGLADIKGRVEYCEALSKDNNKEHLILKNSHEKHQNSIYEGFINHQDQINTLCMEVDELKAEIAKLKPKTTKSATRTKPSLKPHEKSPRNKTTKK